MTCIKRKRSATALFNALCVVRSLNPQRQKNLTNATLTNALYAMNMENLQNTNALYNLWQPKKIKERKNQSNPETPQKKKSLGLGVMF